MMKKKPAKLDGTISLLNPTGREAVDKAVQVPAQVRRAVALAEARLTGKTLAPPPEAKRTQPEPKLPYTDAEIDDALQYMDSGDLDITDPRGATILGLAREGARLITAHRRGARKNRKKSDAVTRRMEVLLQAYRELPRNLQDRPTGEKTLHSLRRAVIAELGVQDSDNVISEETIKKDIQQLGPLLRLVRNGTIPSPGKPIQELKAGKRAVANAAVAVKPSK
jgi:hypothetical protein